MRLSEQWSEILLLQPETGMGYQKVDITLKDGTVYQDVDIVNGDHIIEVSGLPDVPFDNDDIAEIIVK